MGMVLQIFLEHPSSVSFVKYTLTVEVITFIDSVTSIQIHTSWRKGHSGIIWITRSWWWSNEFILSFNGDVLLATYRSNVLIRILFQLAQPTLEITLFFCGSANLCSSCLWHWWPPWSSSHVIWASAYQRHKLISPLHYSLTGRVIETRPRVATQLVFELELITAPTSWLMT